MEGISAYQKGDETDWKSRAAMKLADPHWMRGMTIS